MTSPSNTADQRAAQHLASTVRNRLPRAIGYLVVTFTLVAVFELWTYPERIRPLVFFYPTATVALAIGMLIARRPANSPSLVFGIASASLALFILAVAAYFVAVQGQSELLALGLLYLVVGSMIALPWGAIPQTAVVAAAVVGYCIASLAGIPTATPRSIHLVGMLSMAALSIASARSLARFHLDLIRRGDEKDALLEIARDLTGNVDLDEVFDRVQGRTARLLACDIVATYFFDHTARVFRLESQFGLPAELVDLARSINVPEDRSVFTSGLLWREKTMAINNPGAYPFFRPDLLVPFTVKALLVAPLFLRERNLGLFVAVRSHDEPFSAEQVDVFDSIARQLSIAMEAADHYRQQQEEAQVAAGLATIGHELISALDTPVLLERMCRVSAEVLRCDTTHAFLRDEATGDFVIRAGHGDTPERWQRLHELRVSAAEVERHTGGFPNGDVGLVGRPSPHPNRPPLPTEMEVSIALCIALRRGDELIGLLSAGRFEPTLFAAREHRIAAGLSQLASFALENARLVHELDDANRVKSDFVANMSHELRTPLNVIIGYNDLLSEEAFGTLTTEQRDIIERMGRRARELLELVNVTLDLSRVEAGTVPLLRREFNVAQLLRDLEAESHLMRMKPQVVMDWDTPPDLPMVYTDPAKLRVVVRNLVSNAIKFTDEGHIHVSAAALDGGVEIAVADTGIGIPLEMQEEIFEPFRQVDGTPGRAGGVGLGLHLVRRLIAMLGGRVSVESELSKGSVFRIWMPGSADDTRERMRDGPTATIAATPR